MIVTVACRECASVDITATKSRDRDKETRLICMECRSVDMTYAYDAFDSVKLDRLRKASSQACKEARAALKKLATFLDGDEK